jgi:hypothetical protein
MKINMEILESEENGGMWREKPSGLLALVGHRPPCSPAATEKTCAHNFEENSSVIAVVDITLGQCALQAFYMNINARHTSKLQTKKRKRENEGKGGRRRKEKRDIG